MTSEQMEAFKVTKEPPEVQRALRQHGFGRGCLMARRLVEAGVPFVEVDLGGWDNHKHLPHARDTEAAGDGPAMSALVEDLEQRGLLQDTAIIWMGEFGRTPRINGTRAATTGPALERGGRRRRHEGRHRRGQDQRDGTRSRPSRTPRKT
jgi:uncharacterized protein (DUF1501 family)